MDTIFVKQVKEGGPAYRAGLCTGDSTETLITTVYCLQIKVALDFFINMKLSEGFDFISSSNQVTV